MLPIIPVTLLFSSLLHVKSSFGATFPAQACSTASFTLHPNDGSGIWPYRSYRSSDITPPVFQVSQSSEDLSPYPIFYGPQNAGRARGEAQAHPIIATAQGQLIWAGPEAPTNNLRVQQLNGQPVISYWIGSGTAGAGGQAGHGYGQVEVLDDTYQSIYTVCPNIEITLPPGVTADCAADVHESLITAYNITQADLTEVGGPQDGWVLDPLAVEVDLDTNEPLFIWSPLAHVALSTSRHPLAGAGTSPSNPWDWFHMNAIQPFDGGFLINARHTWSTYFIDRSGDIQWTINGDDGGDFGSLPDGAQFSWQHHARLSKQSGSSDQVLLTYFANNNDDLTTLNPSTGLSLLLDLPPSKSTSPTLVLRLADDADPVYSYAEGSHQQLDNGNQFLSYGIRPVLKEFGPDGAIRWTAQFGYRNNNNTGSSYRAFKHDWHATPAAAISLVVQAAAADDALNDCAAGSSWRGFVSWNGATDVTGYVVYGGADSANLQPLTTIASSSFETEFVVPQEAQFVQVTALQDGQDGEVGASSVIAVQ
nr:hypothetical protein CFP56_20562 [Quercus suber]